MGETETKEMGQTFGLMYGDEYKHSFLTECKRVLKDGGLISFSGHDYNFEILFM